MKTPTNRNDIPSQADLITAASGALSTTNGFATATDTDWYRFTAAAGTFTATLDSVASEGELNIELYDVNGNKLDGNYRSENRSTVSAELATAQEVRVFIYGSGGFQGNVYDISWAGQGVTPPLPEPPAPEPEPEPEPPTTPPGPTLPTGFDAYDRPSIFGVDGNAFAGQTTDLSGIRNNLLDTAGYATLRNRDFLDVVNDRIDLYRVPAAAGIFQITLDVISSEGANPNLFFSIADQERQLDFDRTGTGTGPLTLTADLPEASEITVRVGAGGQSPFVVYNLSWNGTGSTETVSETDPYPENDTISNATRLTSAAGSLDQSAGLARADGPDFYRINTDRAGYFTVDFQDDERQRVFDLRLFDESGTEIDRLEDVIGSGTLHARSAVTNGYVVEVTQQTGSGTYGGTPYNLIWSTQGFEENRVEALDGAAVVLPAGQGVPAGTTLQPDLTTAFVNRFGDTAFLGTLNGPDISEDANLVVAVRDAAGNVYLIARTGAVASPTDVGFVVGDSIESLVVRGFNEFGGVAIGGEVRGADGSITAFLSIFDGLALSQVLREGELIPGAHNARVADLANAEVLSEGPYWALGIPTQVFSVRGTSVLRVSEGQLDVVATAEEIPELQNARRIIGGIDLNREGDIVFITRTTFGDGSVLHASRADDTPLLQIATGVRVGANQASINDAGQILYESGRYLEESGLLQRTYRLTSLTPGAAVIDLPQSLDPASTDDPPLIREVLGGLGPQGEVFVVENDRLYRYDFATGVADLLAQTGVVRGELGPRLTDGLGFRNFFSGSTGPVFSGSYASDGQFILHGDTAGTLFSERMDRAHLFRIVGGGVGSTAHRIGE